MKSELHCLMHDISEKSRFKFRHVREAFRPLDVRRDGKITLEEMQSFLRGFGWPERTADRLFALLDENGQGYIEYADFMAHFDAVLGPANRPAPRQPAVAVSNPTIEQEINEIASLIGERLLTKYSTIREAFRTLDLTNSGQITRTEMRLFFRSLNLGEEVAIRFFNSLLREGSDIVLYDDFAALFGTSGPGGKWQSIDDFRHLPRPTALRSLR